MKQLHFLFVSVSLFWLAISLSACAGTAQATIESPVVASRSIHVTATAEVAPAATPPPQRSSSIKLENCTIGTATAQCGTYRVYENRSTRSGHQIDLKIALLPATGAHVEPDPLFYFTGGPGGEATDVAPMLKTELNELNKTRDVDSMRTGDGPP